MEYFDVMLAKALSGSGGGGGGGSDAMFAEAIDRSIVNLVIPSGITKVGHSAFRNCTSLKSVIIPQSVTTLDLYAFSGCSSLMDITLLRTDAPVTALGSNSLTSVPSNCNIWVPANLVDRYKIASVWDTRANYIKAIQ